MIPLCHDQRLPPSNPAIQPSRGQIPPSVRLIAPSPAPNLLPRYPTNTPTVDRPPGWLELSKFKKRFFFRVLPPPEEWKTYVTIMEAFATDIAKDRKLRQCDQIVV